ncbi:MAG: hypothetical protein KC877_02005 [Candidatus Kaiserbacteria bacterium]|nr:hypothetical protein [Candidatus Kaiserbacteria bacterium]MCB9816191.1 hypothetical protein [Candidatus Nomurabacteria bacterium]
MSKLFMIAAAAVAEETSADGTVYVDQALWLQAGTSLDEAIEVCRSDEPEGELAVFDGAELSREVLLELLPFARAQAEIDADAAVEEELEDERSSAESA